MVDSTGMCRFLGERMVEPAKDAGRRPCWWQGRGRGHRPGKARRASQRCITVESTIEQRSAQGTTASAPPATCGEQEVRSKSLEDLDEEDEEIAAAQGIPGLSVLGPAPGLSCWRMRGVSASTL